MWYALSAAPPATEPEQEEGGWSSEFGIPGPSYHGISVMIRLLGQTPPPSLKRPSAKLNKTINPACLEVQCR